MERTRAEQGEQRTLHQTYLNTSSLSLDGGPIPDPFEAMSSYPTAHVITLTRY